MLVGNLSKSDLGREEDHLHRVFSNNGYPEAIIRAGSEGSPGRREEEVRDEQGDKPLVVTIPMCLASVRTSDVCAGDLTSRLHLSQG